MTPPPPPRAPKRPSGPSRPARPQDRAPRQERAPQDRRPPPRDRAEPRHNDRPAAATPAAAARPPRPPRDPNELKTYGLHACEALFENRAGDIVRVYVTEPLVKRVGPLLRWCADQRKAYHVVSDEDMERVTASVHHEGICILAKAPPLLDDAGLLARVAARRGPVCVVYLDGVQNPHNIGSILRVAAHFGAPFLAGRAAQLPRLSPSAVRVAEGGAERVQIAALAQPEATLAALKTQGFALYATSSHEGQALFGADVPERTVMMLGAEVLGMSPKLMAAADATLRIPGTRAVESLNVAMACGLLLGEFWRRNMHTPPPAP